MTEGVLWGTFAGAILTMLLIAHMGFKTKGENSGRDSAR